MNTIIDTHVHSHFSFDGENSPEELIERAIALGLTALIFTDHADVNDFYNDFYKHNIHLAGGKEHIPPLIERYRGRIDVGFGVELGQYFQNQPLSEQLIADYGFDYVIGSTHNVKNSEDFYYMDFTKQNPEKLLALYFEEMLEMVQKADIDVIGHLTYPLRYIEGKYKIIVDLQQYTEIIHEIFKAAVSRNLGLEINTGGLRKPDYGKPDPGLEYVKMFRDAGGEIITIGSDAHRINELAANFSVGAEIAKAAGFTRAAYFKQRKPIFVEL